MPTVAHPDSNTDSTPDTCSQYKSGFHIRAAQKMTRAAWRERKWKDGSPVRRGQRNVIRYHIDCLGLRKDQKAIGRVWREQKKQFLRWRAYRLIASEPGFRGEGRWLRWLVIPRWVVEAETQGYGNVPGSRGPRWLAVNPSSGACGPYQLNGHTSCDTSSYKDKMRHHRTAARLPRGSWEVGY